MCYHFELSIQKGRAIADVYWANNCMIDKVITNKVTLL